MASVESGDTQLAAIMFTDIAAYSRLMEEDEQRTIALLETHNTIVLPLIEAAGGEVIDAIGDGLFILFPSVRDTVTCATSICDAIAAHNNHSGPDQQFHLRIGIHLGEIWRRDERVYGNGVNIAARVQPFARPGGICVTEDVYRQVATRPEIQTESIGQQKLRNISRSLELYHVQTGHEVEDQSQQHGEGEFDAVKERILRERQKISEKREHHGGGSDGRIESKIYKLVDHAMDKALDKWEHLPPEKKKQALAELRKESDGKSNDIQITMGSKTKKESKDSILAPGLVMGIGFGLGYFSFDIAWMVWPFIFFGVLPFTAGVLKQARQLLRKRKADKERPSHLQHVLLRLAKDNGGRLTVVQAASTGQMSLQEAQSALDLMAREGYVVQTIGDNGSMSYEFPGILPAGHSSSSM